MDMSPQVFDIEDEVTLDQGDVDRPITPGQDPGRPPSSAVSIRKRPSFGAQSQPNTPDMSGRSSPPSQTHPRPRAISQRLAGFAQAVTQHISPLAQVYAPLTVNHDIPEDAVASTSPAQTPSVNGVSYGPTTRRRLSSMVHRRTSNDPGVFQPFPTGESGSSVSSSHHREEHSHVKDHSPRMVTEIESEEEQMCGSAMLEGRLAGIEERQRRIEEMLTQLTSTCEAFIRHGSSSQ